MTCPWHWRTLCASRIHMKAKLGRATDKPGRKADDVLTTQQREAVHTFGKYARFNGLIIETKDFADCTELLTHI